MTRTSRRGTTHGLMSKTDHREEHKARCRKKQTLNRAKDKESENEVRYFRDAEKKYL